MPHSLVEKLAREKNMSVKEAELKWEEAKSKAAEEGKRENFGYVTEIFKRLMGVTESSVKPPSTFLARASTVIVRRRK